MSRRRRARALLSRTDRRTLLRIVVIGVGAFLAGYILTALLFFRDADRPAVVTIPDLRELRTETARRQLDRLGLDLEVGDSLPNLQVPPGQILAQSPLPGREAAPGTSVRVILSTGAPQRSVPDVRMLGRAAAVRLLSASGFRVLVDSIPSAQPAGRLLGVDPAPGTVVRLPAQVRLRVSAGPPLIEVPTLIGYRPDEATAALEAAGLVLGEMTRQFDPGAGEERIVGQNPEPGDSIPLGSPVQIRILSDRLLGEPVPGTFQ